MGIENKPVTGKKNSTTYLYHIWVLFGVALIMWNWRSRLHTLLTISPLKSHCVWHRNNLWLVQLAVSWFWHEVTRMWTGHRGSLIPWTAGVVVCYADHCVILERLIIAPMDSAMSNQVTLSKVCMSGPLYASKYAPLQSRINSFNEEHFGSRASVLNWGSEYIRVSWCLEKCSL